MKILSEPRRGVQTIRKAFEVILRRVLSSYFQWADWRTRSSRSFMLRHLRGHRPNLVVEIEGGDQVRWSARLGLQAEAVVAVVPMAQGWRSAQQAGRTAPARPAQPGGRTQVCSDVVGVMERLPLQGGSVDLVICSEALEHSQRPRKVLAEAARLLRRGGVLLVTAPDGEMASGYTFPILGRDRFEEVERRSGHVATIRRSDLAIWGRQLGLRLQGDCSFHRSPLGAAWWELFTLLGLEGRRWLRALTHLVWPAVGFADLFVSRGGGLWLGLAFVKR